MEKGKRFFIISASILLFIGTFYLISIINFDFARFVDSYLSAPIRRALSLFFSIFPFSFFEFFIVISPILVILIVLSILRCKNEISQINSRFLCAVSVFILFLSLYLLTVGIAYKAPMISSKAAELESELTSEDYVFAAEYIISELEKLENEREEISEKMLISEFEKSFSKLNGAKVKLPQFKRLFFSPLFTRLGIYGVYSFFTSEVNINPDLPIFLFPFNLAHEYAHFLGASGEADANFLAFLVCIDSDFSMVKFSALVISLKSILIDIYKNDAKMYTKLYEKVPNPVKKCFEEWKTFDSISKNPVGNISAQANGAILGAVDKNGRESYSLLSDFVTAFITAKVGFA